ncbi:MAG: FCD domain-containing protein, partial [Chloroflexi bacterium]|nr:FCD domain-containing protein [Chloroflexota bacterium]
QGDEEAAVQADLIFHRTLVQLSGNSRLIKVWDSLLAQARFVLRKHYAIQNKAGLETLASNHLVVLNVLKQDDDIDRIIKIIEEHLDIARVGLLENWQEVIGAEK